MKNLIEYLGEEGLLKALTLIKTALAGKQDKMKEITAEETRALWNEVVTENTTTPDVPEA